MPLTTFPDRICITGEPTYIFFLCIILIFSTRFFQSTPFEKIFFELQAIFLLLIGIFVVTYLILAIKINNRVNNQVLFFSFLIALVPLYSAWRANQEFGQPYIYGILAQRKWIILGVGILFFYWIKNKKISLKTFEKSFVIMSWLSLIIFTLFYIYFLFHPSCLHEKKMSSLLHLTRERGLRIKFNSYFIVFGTLYYMIKSEVERKTKYFVYLILFLLYIFLISKGRSQIIYLGITALFFYYFRFPFDIKLLKFLKLLFLVIFLVGVAQLIEPAYVEKMGFLFQQMFKVLTGTASQDTSANSRIFQSLTIFKYLASHVVALFLGVGRLSHQWRQGFNGIWGHLYPTDVGLIGVIFVYGIVGSILIYLLPFIKCIRLVFVVNDKTEEDSFVLTLKYMLFFIVIGSISMGNIVFTPYIYIIPYFILYAALLDSESVYSVA